MHFELGDSRMGQVWKKDYTEVFCIIPSNFSLSHFPLVTLPPLCIQLRFSIGWHVCVLLSCPLICCLASLCSVEAPAIVKES